MMLEVVIDGGHGLTMWVQWWRSARSCKVVARLARSWRDW